MPLAPGSIILHPFVLLELLLEWLLSLGEEPPIMNLLMIAGVWGGTVGGIGIGLGHHRKVLQKQDTSTLGYSLVLWCWLWVEKLITLLKPCQCKYLILKQASGLATTVSKGSGMEHGFMKSHCSSMGVLIYLPPLFQLILFLKLTSVSCLEIILDSTVKSSILTLLLHQSAQTTPPSQHAPADQNKAPGSQLKDPGR